MEYDVIILGGGPGGYLAAERAAQAGLRTLCAEEQHLGGTCLNEGCIPTKTMLCSAKLRAHALEGGAYGVRCDAAVLDQGAVADRKRKVVRKLVAGVKAALRESGAEVAAGRGVITGRDAAGRFHVQVDQAEHTAGSLIVATGSECLIPPIPGLQEGLDSGFVLTNREFLELRELPERLTVIGGGVIGLEMAAYAQMAGSSVTVAEMLDHIAGPADRELAGILQGDLSRGGMTFALGTRVTAVEPGAVVCARGEECFRVPADRVLLAIGRRPRSRGFGLEELGVRVERDAVVTDEYLRTSVPGVWAVGDVNGKSMLAHTAYREAEAAVRDILGQPDPVSYRAIPTVLYTVPELASVGLTEEEAQSRGMNAAVVKLPMQFSGRYVAENERGDGLCKLVFDRDSDTLAGAQVLASGASEFIAAAGILIELRTPAEQMRRMVFPHPTVSEILREAIARYQN
jgi:dihydrolipoamide dehydrogenase